MLTRLNSDQFPTHIKSLCCTPETNTMLCQLHLSFFKKGKKTGGITKVLLRRRKKTIILSTVQISESSCTPRNRDNDHDRHLLLISETRHR